MSIEITRWSANAPGTAKSPTAKIARTGKSRVLII
jgi:hypothetical protein